MVGDRAASSSHIRLLREPLFIGGKMSAIDIIELLLIGWSLYRINQLQQQLDKLSQADPEEAEEVAEVQKWEPIELSDEREYELEEMKKRRLSI